MGVNISGGGTSKGETTAKSIMPSGGGKSSVVRSVSHKAPKGGGKLVGGPSPEYRQTSAGTSRYDLGSAKSGRGRRM
jgi:hypothetical protein